MHNGEVIKSILLRNEFVIKYLFKIFTSVQLLRCCILKKFKFEHINCVNEAYTKKLTDKNERVYDLFYTKTT